MSEPGDSPQGDAVQRHYKALAADYGSRANPACDFAYRNLVARYVGADAAALEMGCGSCSVLPASPGVLRVGCDFSLAMLRAGEWGDGFAGFAGDVQKLPCRDGAFDAVVTINVLEHATDPQRMLEEAARVLAPGGVLVAVTPNGNVAWLLEALEKLHLKLPEGPHRFLTVRALRAMTANVLRVETHDTFLALPAGPPSFVGWVDRFAPFGLFQFVVGRKA
jgi:SAM-dependent methyltransferase